MTKYFNKWANIKEVHDSFIETPFTVHDILVELHIIDFPTDKEILFASYIDTGDCADAIILYKRDKKLYYNQASHCSCYNLEGQWKPEEVHPKQLAMMAPLNIDHGKKAIKKWENIIKQICKNVTKELPKLNPPVSVTPTPIPKIPTPFKTNKIIKRFKSGDLK